MSKPAKTSAEAENQQTTEDAELHERVLHERVLHERVLIVSAPAGARRRAGMAFGPEPRELTKDELGDDPEATIDVLRADPMLKLDFSLRKIGAE